MHQEDSNWPLAEGPVLKRKFDDIFAEFDEKPLGVGAIAQVYKARLKPDLARSEDTDMDPEAQMTMRKRIRRNVDSLVKSTPQRVPSQYVAMYVSLLNFSTSSPLC